MVWVYDRTESLVVAILMHASLTAGMLILQPLEIAGVCLLARLVAFDAAWWAVVAVVTVASGGQLSRVPTPTRAVLKRGGGPLL